MLPYCENVLVTNTVGPNYREVEMFLARERFLPFIFYNCDPIFFRPKGQSFTEGITLILDVFLQFSEVLKVQYS